jgi:hypothetical protein
VIELNHEYTACKVELDVANELNDATKGAALRQLRHAIARLIKGQLGLLVYWWRVNKQGDDMKQCSALKEEIALLQGAMVMEVQLRVDQAEITRIQRELGQVKLENAQTETRKVQEALCDMRDERDAMRRKVSSISRPNSGFWSIMVHSCGLPRCGWDWLLL